MQQQANLYRKRSRSNCYDLWLYFCSTSNSTANYTHLIKAITAAEAYDGPSLVICYSPCIAHGIKGGLGYSGEQGELATKCGYWPLYTFDPRLEEQGKIL